MSKENYTMMCLKNKERVVSGNVGDLMLNSNIYIYIFRYPRQFALLSGIFDHLKVFADLSIPAL